VVAAGVSEVFFGITGHMITRILVVEDEAVVALANAAILEALGYEVVGPTDTAEEALALASTEQPTLALVDIRIKGEMDGIELGERLRQRGCGVVFVTGQNDKATRGRAEAIKPDGYLLKPFTPEGLDETIAAVIAEVRRR
jgi:CheY-like chemotaxis protein